MVRGVAALQGGRGMGPGRPVVGLGLCVLDEIHEVDHLDLAATRIRYRTRLTAVGGMVANALAQAAALGCRTQLLTAVGDDADGVFALKSLRALGVGTRRVVRSAATPTTTAVVLVERGSGERRLLVPDRRSIERAAPEFPLTGIRRGSIVLVDGHFPRQASAALARAREVGARVVADFSAPRPAYLRMLRRVDHAIVPLEFVEAWGLGGPRETLRALAERCRGVPVVTLGAKGALALVDGRFRRVRPHRVRVRDTTGAGDAFHGAFAAGLAADLPLLEALDLASRAGAVACTALGTTTRLLGVGPPRGRLGRGA